MLLTPADTESAFFQAIKHADIDAMMRVWHLEEAVGMHFLGEHLDEVKAIETNWRRIYSHPASIRFGLDKGRRRQHDTLVLHCASPVPGSGQPVDIHPGWVP